MGQTKKLSLIAKKISLIISISLCYYHLHSRHTIYHSTQNKNNIQCNRPITQTDYFSTTRVNILKINRSVVFAMANKNMLWSESVNAHLAPLFQQKRYFCGLLFYHFRKLTVDTVTPCMVTNRDQLNDNLNDKHLINILFVVVAHPVVPTLRLIIPICLFSLLILMSQNQSEIESFHVIRKSLDVSRGFETILHVASMTYLIFSSRKKQFLPYGITRDSWVHGMQSPSLLPLNCPEAFQLS